MREAMAEAIWEMEREEQEMEGRRNDERRRAQAEETGLGPPTISST
jgi:hypothetical protein